MNKTYRDWSPDQPSFFPPSPRDVIPKMTRFTSSSIPSLPSTSPPSSPAEPRTQGQPVSSPDDGHASALLLRHRYTLLASHHESLSHRRCLPRHRQQRHPGFHLATSARSAVLETLFIEVLKLCALAGLAKVGTISLDGTKVKANASRHKAMSYDRMQEEETRLKEEIAKMLAEAQAADETEDAAAPTGTAMNCPMSWRDGRSRLATRSSRQRLAWAGRDQGSHVTEPSDEAESGRGGPSIAPADVLGARSRPGGLHRPRVADHKDATRQGRGIRS